MKLIVQPDDGLAPLMKAIRGAKRSIEIVIFRFDRMELAKALQAAVARGVVVRAVIAHSNSGGEKRLRKLELQLLEWGCTVARTADDLPRYHGKFLIVDDTLFVFGFNYTRLDLEKSRSFGLMTRETKLVKEARSLFEADRHRRPYSPTHDRFIVSPENSRELLTGFIRKAKKQLLIYDAKVTDKLIHRVLLDRARAGVEIRVLGKLDKAPDTVHSRSISWAATGRDVSSVNESRNSRRLALETNGADGCDAAQDDRPGQEDEADAHAITCAPRSIRTACRGTS